jgi:hypothetical protein
MELDLKDVGPLVADLDHVLKVTNAACFSSDVEGAVVGVGTAGSMLDILT